MNGLIGSKRLSPKNISNIMNTRISVIQEIGTGGFGKVYRANWKNSYKHLALKSFFNFNDATIKEVVNEVIDNIQ